ncbi:MAG: ubiquinone/menaquinone biosynthesis C-methylase UbiE [Gammaproteobacteria bacterium]|jgi:ubiquinone/menaquinone biosynthesis C-methylase UbiE/DNA-binding transcriptional ArsR family regulator
MYNLDTLLAGLRAAGEHTRLRILTLCARGELSVSELVQILGQSQPRVSRHLKLMVEAGLLERLPEGAQVYFRVSDLDTSSKLTHALISLIPDTDALLIRDMSRLVQIRDSRAKKAQDYFQQVAESWNTIRALHVPEQQLEQTLLEVIGTEPIGDLLDIGTGTGRALEVLADHFTRGVGVDLSSGMLAIARSNIERAGLTHVHVRKGDMYHLPMEDASVDLAILSLVLHYSDDPTEVVREASRVLRDNGRLVIVDFAAHTEEYLRTEFKHFRLGFSDDEILNCFEGSSLVAATDTQQLVGDPLTVKIWHAQKQSNLVSIGLTNPLSQGRAIK